MYILPRTIISWFVLFKKWPTTTGHGGEQRREYIRAEMFMEINIFINSVNCGKEGLSENGCPSLGHQITIQDVIRCFRFLTGMRSGCFVKDKNNCLPC